MTLPLVLLAIPSLGLGAVLAWPGIPFTLFTGEEATGTLHGWLHPVFEEAEEILHLAHETFPLGGEVGLILASVAAATLGLVVAWWLFGLELFGLRLRQRPERVEQIAGSSGVSRFLYRASLNKWWFDDLNHLLFMVIGGRLAALAWWFDREVVDGTVNGIATLTRASGRNLARVQTGRVQNYALGIAIGLIVMVGSYLYIAGQ